MKPTITTLILLFFTMFAFGQGKGIKFKYKAHFEQFDSLNNAKNKDAKNILKYLQNTNDYKTNDSLKTMISICWAIYYIVNEDNINNVNKYCDECINIALKSKMYGIASKCAHNKAVAYDFKDRLDTAIILENKAALYARKGNDLANYFKAKLAISRRMANLGEYQKSSELLKKIIDSIDDPETKGVGYLVLASNSYETQTNLKNTDLYFKKALKLIKCAKYDRLIWEGIRNYSKFLNSQKRYKEALLYSDSITIVSKSIEANAANLMIKSNAYFGLNNSSKAIELINQKIILDNKIKDDFELALDYKERGKIYENIGNNKLSLIDYKQAKTLFKNSEGAQELDFYKHYIHTYLKINNPDIVNDFLLFLKINDSIYKNKASNNLFDIETKFKVVDKDIQIQQAKNKQNIGIGIIGVLGLLTVGGFLWFKNKQKTTALQNQNAKLSLQHNLNLMQLDNLNKQLDPHEIKNILANISPEIQRKAPEAYDKMTKLLNITRASLSINSITDSIENQLQQIEDYLSLEKTVLEVPLSYSINNSVENSKQIPRLLLKNLVENSIKHGIKNKKEGGNIDVVISENNNHINIVIDDTGIGRQHAISLDSGIGTSTYINLFTTLNKKNTANASFNFIDKQEGTTVAVVIPENYKYV